MIKSLSLSDTQHANPFHNESQGHFRSVQQKEEEHTSENTKQVSQTLVTESQNSLSPAPGDRYKKRIKLRLNQHFPSDFFENHVDDSQDDKKYFPLKNIPVKLIRAPELRHVKTNTPLNQRYINNSSNFGSQLIYPSSNAQNEERSMTLRAKQLEGQSSRESGSESRIQILPIRSISNERGSLSGAGLYSLRMRPQPLSTKMRFEETNQLYSNLSQFPLSPLDNELKTISKSRFGGFQTPRKDNFSNLGKTKIVTFNLHTEDRAQENETNLYNNKNPLIVSNSYYFNQKTYQMPQTELKQSENELQSLQMFRKEPVKLTKSTSRESFNHENDFLRASRTNRLYLQSISKEQTSLPLASSRKILKIFRRDEPENSRVTSDRDMEIHFSTEPNQVADTRVLNIPKSVASFHKAIAKSGLVFQEEVAVGQSTTSISKTVSMPEQAYLKESSVDLISRIGKKVAEQKKQNESSQANLSKEAFDFSFSKEYSKEENQIGTFISPSKEIKDKSLSPERQESPDYRNMESRNHSRIKKKFLLIKKEE